MEFGYDPGVASGVVFSDDGEMLFHAQDVHVVEELGLEPTDAVVDKVFSEMSRQAEFTMTMEAPISFETWCHLVGIVVQELPKTVASEILGFEPARRHRKKRVQKKWNKRYGFRPIFGPERSILLDGTLYVGPDTHALLMESSSGEAIEALKKVGIIV